MRYQTKRDENLANKLHKLIGEACAACPDAKVAQLQGNHITLINENITEYVVVYLFPGTQVCVHRTICEGRRDLGCDILRVWKRTLPDDVAVDQLTGEIKRMLGHRAKVEEEIAEFKRAALEFMAEGMKV